MSSDVVMQLMGKVLWGGLVIAAPLLAVTLVVGLLISVLQVATQVQDMSLSFIPKLVATVVALLLFGPWMLRTLVALCRSLIANIPSYL